ncbi:hypothetical protein [Nocardia farcinica]|uniref:hypothetical protein n=1 Tax=Nocardia farcinica TaxID=37329 RepID=UPI002456E190|nr:hypothetical protein [Nocardia farcinica]
MDTRDDRRRVSPGEWLARMIAVVLLVPVRMLWEGARLCGRAVGAACRYLLDRLIAPVGRVIWYWVVRPLWLFAKDAVWGWALHHVLWGMVLTPLGAFLLDRLLRPLRRAVEEWVWRRVLRPGLVLLWRWVLRPIGYAVAVVAGRLWRWCVEWPLRVLWRWVLRPLWVAVAAVAWFGWRAATAIVDVLVVRPCRLLYRVIVGPVLRWVAEMWRFAVVRPVRFVHRRVVAPMNRVAAEVLSAVFGR